MRWIQNLLAVAVLGSILGGAAAMAAGDEGDTMTTNISNANNQFALDLYAKLRVTPGNLIESPYSISSALAMTCEGANGQTAQQMKSCLHLPDGDFGSGFAALSKHLQGAKGYELNIANALWKQKGYDFLPAFTDLLAKQYDAGLRDADFQHTTEAARTAINTWVEDQTHDKIKDLLQPGTVTAQTKMVLVNAIYFKGKWATQFKKERTQESPFTVLGDSAPKEPVSVQMMQQTAEFRYMQDDGLSILEMPYVGEDISMVVLLPDTEDKTAQQSTAALTDMESKLTNKNLSQWLGKLHKSKVEVYLPRFTATAEFQLGSVLQQMGMMDAFSSQLADFSGMTGKKDLCISDVIHKAFVDVNEEGTEAAAATAVGMRSMAIMRNPVFRADHSFVYLIRDMHSGAILFMGRVSNPATGPK